MSKPYAIFGAGLSAQAACRLARVKGIEVVMIDEAGGGDQVTFSEADLARFACLVFSPGFAADHPWRVLAEGADLACLSEIAFAAKFWEGAIIGVTGTNGKTTLTALIKEALASSGHTSVATGNIGYPFSDAVISEANKPGAYAVLEISSFQAELSEGLQLDALLWTNFAEDHLDRYGSMSTYFRAKAKLFDCIKHDGICVIGPQVAHWIAIQRNDFRAYVVASEDAVIGWQLAAGSVFHRFPYVENFSMAAELWGLLKLPPAALREAANVFVAAPHRLNVVAERRGVRFWNDSKATNFHATLAALKSVDRPIIWIGGGRLKGGDVESFAQIVASHVDAAVLYGEVAQRLAEAFEGLLDSVQVLESFNDAVLAAAELATTISAANVVLSPGFASFDQFKSYADRGKSFNSIVLSLKDARKPS